MGTAPLRYEPPRAGRATSLFRQVMIVVTLAIAGALIAVGVVQVRGSQYRATISVRSPTADATCIYFSCQPPVPTSSGHPYVLDQVNAIESLTLASNVRRSLQDFTGTAEDLRSTVKAKEVGASPTIDISYTADTKHNASEIAKTYATEYVLWSNSQAIASLTELSKSVNDDWRKILDQGTAMAQSPRGATVFAEKVGVTNGITLYRQANSAVSNGDASLSGPNGARMYDSARKFAVQAVQTTPSTAKTAGLGAFAGIVLGIGLVLLLPSLGAGAGGGPRGRAESLPIEPIHRDLVGSEVTKPIEPVR
jgi:capsular polysaccharide biosynthesis protein